MGKNEASEPDLVYRGVHARHPALDAARQGTVVPGNEQGSVTAAEHNLGGYSADSPFTSWTHDVEVARAYANSTGHGGVILKLPVGRPPAGATWSWEFSPDVW